MEKYEYKVIDKRIQGAGEKAISTLIELLETDINELNSKGWELVSAVPLAVTSVVGSNTDAVILIIRRKI